MIDAGEVDRDPVAGLDLVDRSIERLERTNARSAMARLHDDLVADFERATRERASHDRARPLRRERPGRSTTGDARGPLMRACSARDGRGRRAARRRRHRAGRPCPRPQRIRGRFPPRARQGRASRARGDRGQRGRSGSARSPRVRCRAARGCAGAPRSAASTPPLPRRRRGRHRPSRLPQACS